MRSIAARTAGIPGGSLHSSSLEQQNVSAGVAGEKLVASIITDYMYKMDDIFLFNSIKLPGQDWDIDHVLVRGNKVYVIDAKRWRGNCAYTFYPGEKGKWFVERDNEPFAGGIVSTTNEARSLAKYLTNKGVDFEIESHLVIASSNVIIDNYPLSGEEKHNNTQIYGHNPPEFRQFLGYQLGKETQKDSLALIQVLRVLAETTYEQNRSFSTEVSSVAQIGHGAKVEANRVPAQPIRPRVPVYTETYSNYPRPVPGLGHDGKGIAAFIISVVSMFIMTVMPIISIPVSLYITVWSIVRLALKKGKLYYWLALSISVVQLIYSAITIFYLLILMVN